MRNLLQTLSLFLIGCLYSFTAINLKAEGITEDMHTYHPLFSEGKSWSMWHGVYAYNPYSHEEDVQTDAWIEVNVEGSKMIDGHECYGMKLSINFTESHPNPYYECPICDRLKKLPEFLYGYEEDGSVYIYRDPGPYYEDYPDYITEPEALYGDPYFDRYFDFSLEEGDKVPFYNGSYSPVKVDYINFGENLRKVISCSSKTHLFDNTLEWIEGIGSPANKPLWNPYWMIPQPISEQVERFCLATCKDDEQQIYDNRQNMVNHSIPVEGFSTTPSGIDTIQKESPATDNTGYFNLQGILVDRPIPGEVYIVSGKKIIFRE